MTPAQERLIVLGAAVTIGGSLFVLFRPRAGVTRDQLVSAGFTSQACAPVVVECEGYLEDECRVRPDGGMRPRYATAKLQAIRCDLDDAGTPLLWIRSPRLSQVRDCFHPIGDVSRSCAVVDPACADADLWGVDMDGEPASKPAQERCACHQMDAGNCRANIALDGGLAVVPPGVTVSAPFVGPGCVRKTCVELFGESSMPAECAP